MKFASIALFGAASANFLQETILELDAAAAPATTTDSAATEPASTEPAATEPAATEPAAAPAAAPAPPQDFSKDKAWDKYAIKNKVGEGFCQPHVGYVFWDLKQMDEHAGIEYIGTGAVGFDGNAFAVELCEAGFDASKMKPYKNSADKTLTVGAIPSTLHKGNAYWTTESSGGETFIPKYSFLSGNFVPTMDEDTEQYNGWTL